MPLLLSKQINNNAAYAVWNIQETLNEIPDMCPEPFPTNLNPVRQAEWIIGRVLIKSLCEVFDIEYQGIGIQDTGKPYLIGCDVGISISHSFPMACAMINLENPCGIDLERPRQKMLSIQDRFLHKSEAKYKDNLENICKIWCAKEVIYKIYGRRKLGFRDEIKVRIKNENTMIGEILRKDHPEKYTILCGWVKDYVIGYNI